MLYLIGLNKKEILQKRFSRSENTINISSLSYVSQLLDERYGCS